MNGFFEFQVNRLCHSQVKIQTLSARAFLKGISSKLSLQLLPLFFHDAFEIVIKYKEYDSDHYYENKFFLHVPCLQFHCACLLIVRLLGRVLSLTG